MGRNYKNETTHKQLKPLKRGKKLKMNYKKLLRNLILIVIIFINIITINIKITLASNELSKEEKEVNNNLGKIYIIGNKDLRRNRII